MLNIRRPKAGHGEEQALGWIVIQVGAYAGTMRFSREEVFSIVLEGDFLKFQAPPPSGDFRNCGSMGRT
jgi:hypothetical protein